MTWIQAHRRKVRAEAARTAYATALDWFQRLPAAEVERRLVAKVKEKELEYEDANRDEQNSRTDRTRTGSPEGTDGGLGPTDGHRRS